MTILLNDTLTRLPKKTLTVADLVEWKELKPQGTAIAINDKLIKQAQWSITQLKEMDNVTIISAAYGG